MNDDKIVSVGLSRKKIEDIEVDANKLGEEGWELVLLSPNDNAVFKREKK